MIKINPDTVIEFLNEIHKLDSEVLEKLIDFRVPVNEKLAWHETVQVVNDGTEEVPTYKVGLLGIINGLCGIDEDGYGLVTANFEFDQTSHKEKLVGFMNRKNIKSFEWK